MNTNIYAAPSTVAMQPAETRAAFIRKTYAHLAGAIGVFALLEAILLNLPATQALSFQLATNKMYWLIAFGFYMVTSWIGQTMAHTATSKGKQYFALGLVVVGWAVMFLPVLFVAQIHPTFADKNIIMKATILTGALFGGITFIALTTKKDFSFLNGILKIAGFVALGLIALSLFGGISLGVWFIVAMIVFAGASILRDTSNVVHHYGTHQYIGAAASLFASVALLFWYIIQLLMSLASSD